MEGRYKCEDHILNLVDAFESATIPRERWKHAEHLTVALYYLRSHDLDAATAKMRAGVFHLVEVGFKVDLKAEMPYHETLTVFWMRTVANFAESRKGFSLTEIAIELIETFGKDYPLRFYSSDRLFSDKARAGFVEGDLRLDD